MLSESRLPRPASQEKMSNSNQYLCRDNVAHSASRNEEHCVSCPDWLIFNKVVAFMHFLELFNWGRIKIRGKT